MKAMLIIIHNNSEIIGCRYDAETIINHPQSNR